MRTVLVFILFYLSTVYGHDDVDAADVGTMSYAFTNILNQLQENPEILGRSDVAVFIDDHDKDPNDALVSYDEDKIGNHRKLDENGLKIKHIHSLVAPRDATIGLTPEEVAEQVLKIEDILEDYNEVKRK